MTMTEAEWLATTDERSMNPLIFLDIDGVLNDHIWDEEIQCGQIHKDKVARLNTILRETDARIVLSSAWRYIVHRGEMNMMGLEWLLRSHGVMANRLIGITDKDAEVVRQPGWDGSQTWVHTTERGYQITSWLLQNGVQGVRYVAIDDMDLGITDAGHPLVLTESDTGLTDIDVAEAIQFLNARLEQPHAVQAEVT